MFILASKSPRRKEILKELIPSFEIIVPEVDESSLLSLVDPLDLAKAESKLKVLSIIKDHPTDYVLSADTVVIVDGKPLGKPKDKDDAIRMLKMQSGKKEEVITGYAFYDGKDVVIGEDVTYVYFNELDDESIEEYINKCQPYDKAGAYGIQEWIGLIGIEAIHGCYYNVMGLPVSRLYRELKKMLTDSDFAQKY